MEPWAWLLIDGMFSYGPGTCFLTHMHLTLGKEIRLFPLLSLELKCHHSFHDKAFRSCSGPPPYKIPSRHVISRFLTTNGPMGGHVITLPCSHQ